MSYDSRLGRDSQDPAFKALHDELVVCRACPRLVAWREEVALRKRASFAGEQYWGKPVPSFGDIQARVVIVGLAPAAHGGNRTGRMFTGDRSGDWLIRAMWRAGWANQPYSISKDDGLVLEDVFVTASVHCAPPANKPTPQERDRCSYFLKRELLLLDKIKVVIALGNFAFDAVCRVEGVVPRPKFSHGKWIELPRQRWMVGSYHPSQQNTFTGRLTEEMLDALFAQVISVVNGHIDPAVLASR